MAGVTSYPYSVAAGYRSPRSRSTRPGPQPRSIITGRGGRSGATRALKTSQYAAPKRSPCVLTMRCKRWSSVAPLRDWCFGIGGLHAYRRHEHVRSRPNDERMGARGQGAPRALEEDTSMTIDALVIDCDGHILEPPDLWETYLEPRYRDRALRVRVGDDGYEYLEIDGRRSTLARPGQLGTLGGMGQRVDDARRLRERAMRGEIKPQDVRAIRPGPEQTYLRGAAFGTMDMKERVQLLDREGMARAILYPTLGLLWEAELFDPELSSAYCRAYNRWIADFCRDSGGRLVPIAHLSLGDPAEAARELERAVADGCRGAFVCPFTITRVPHGDPRHDAVFAAAQDLDVPFAIHPTFEPTAWNVHHRYDKFGWASWYFDLLAGQGVQQAFATLFQLGVF